MPRLWLAYSPEDDYYFFSREAPSEECRAVEVDINNSLYRQVQAAETKYQRFQAAMERWMEEAEAGRLRRISDGR